MRGDWARPRIASQEGRAELQDESFLCQSVIIAITLIWVKSRW